MQDLARAEITGFLKSSDDISQVCRKAGVSRGTAYNIINGLDYSLRTLEKFAVLMGKEAIIRLEKTNTHNECFDKAA